MSATSKPKLQGVSLYLSRHLRHWHRLTASQQADLMLFAGDQAIAKGLRGQIAQFTLDGDVQSGDFRVRQIDYWLDELPSLRLVVDNRCRHLYMSRLHAIQRSAPVTAGKLARRSKEEA